MQKAFLLVLFSFAIFLGTVFEFAIPGTTIMQTGQTIAVLCAGALLGPRLGFASVLFYLLLGVVGLPVFSEGASGLPVFAGPSGGYLFGFTLAAAVMGCWKKVGLMRSPIACFAGMLLGHAIILTCGWAWMSVLIGSEAAYTNGIAPFYLGSSVKSGLAAGLVLLIQHMPTLGQRALSLK